MKHYLVNLQHDGGNITAETFASSIERAKALVCNAEKAPLSAVKWWQVVPTPKQIRRTKSLLRNL